jgi:N-methylhydantoinase B
MMSWQALLRKGCAGTAGTGEGLSASAATGEVEIAAQPDPDARAEGVELSIFASRARNIAWMIGSSVVRSARSTLIQQGDLAAGVLDRAGRVIALDEHLPLMAYSLGPGARAILDFFGDDIHSGDVFIHNDVWHGNIQHADTGIFMPVFHSGALAGWVACRGHWADIGGAVAGTANPNAREVWEEALRIPPVRLIAGGRECRDVWNLVFSNVRVRNLVESDARAQIGACTLGAKALAELVARSGGLNRFTNLIEGLFQSSGNALDAALGKLPRRRFHGISRYIDDSPEGVTEYPVQVAIDFSGSKVVIDFAGSAPQTATMMNSPLPSTTAAALVTILTLLGPNMQHDEGVLSRFEVRAPSGSMLNAAFPAATFGGNKLCEAIGTAIMNAFTEALPDRVCAEWSRRLSLRVGGVDPRYGRRYQEMFFLTYGGGGAARQADGYNQPGLMSGGNVVHRDYEHMELQAPMIVWKHEYAAGSAGNGRWRGGFGNETIIEHYGRDVVFVTHGSGTTVGAQGVFGGASAVPNVLEIRTADGTIRHVHAREKVGPLSPPVTSRQVTGGGGGYGRPEDRDLEACRKDALEELTAATEAPA